MPQTFHQIDIEIIWSWLSFVVYPFHLLVVFQYEHNSPCRKFIVCSDLMITLKYQNNQLPSKTLFSRCVFKWKIRVQKKCWLTYFTCYSCKPLLTSTWKLSISVTTNPMTMAWVWFTIWIFFKDQLKYILTDLLVVIIKH